MAHTNAYTPSPMLQGSCTNFAPSSPPSARPRRPIVIPLSYERLIVRFRAAQISTLEQYPDLADSARVADIQFMLGEAVASAEAGIAGEDVVSPGNLKHLVMEKIREIHEQHEALRESDDAEDENEGKEGSEKSVDGHDSHNEEPVEQYEARKTVEVSSTSTVNVQALSVANRVYSRPISVSVFLPSDSPFNTNVFRVTPMMSSRTPISSSGSFPSPHPHPPLSAVVLSISRAPHLRPSLPPTSALTSPHGSRRRALSSSHQSSRKLNSAGHLRNCSTRVCSLRPLSFSPTTAAQKRQRIRRVFTSTYAANWVWRWIMRPGRLLRRLVLLVGVH